MSKLWFSSQFPARESESEREREGERDKKRANFSIAMDKTQAVYATSEPGLVGNPADHKSTFVSFFLSVQLQELEMTA